MYQGGRRTAIELYWPVPVRFIVSTPGFAESVTVMAPGRVPMACGVNVTTTVHLACAPRLPVQGVVPPEVTVNSPLPVIVGVNELARLLVSVTVCDALVVATGWAAKVSDVGVNEIGRAEVPFTSKICCPTEALSVTTTAPLMVPLDPNAGAKVTVIVQLAPAAKFKFAAHGVVPLPVTANSALVPSELKVIALALVFFTVTDFPVLVVPTACAVKVSVVGVNDNGGVLPPEPVPDRPTTCGLNVVESLIDNAPFTAPAAPGVNVTATLHFPFAARMPVQVVPVEATA